MDWSLSGSSVHGSLQARILEWVAISSSREFSQPRDQTQVSCIAGGFFNHLSHQGNPDGRKKCIKAWICYRAELFLNRGYVISTFCFSSVQFSRSVVSDSLRPHESQHARPPCPSPTPRVHSNSRPLSQ